MSKAVLISIKPEWVERIADGSKVVEVRKNKPKLPIPFKCYIYESQGRRYSWGVKPDTIANHDEDRFLDCRRGMPDVKKDDNGNPYFSYGRMRVIGEFVCDEIKDYYPIDTKDPINKPYGDEIEKESCLSTKQVNDYGFRTLGYGMLFGLHITDLVIYDKPKELREFRTLCKYRNDDGSCQYKKVDCECVKFDFNPDYSVNFAECCDFITRPPQSWCYVEEIDAYET